MDVTETERLWIFGLLLQDGGEERGFIKDDIPEEVVSMEWMEEQEEEDSESWKSKHTPEGNRTVRTLANSALSCKAEVNVETNKLQYLLYNSPQHTCVSSLMEALPWQRPVNDSETRAESLCIWGAKEVLSFPEKLLTALKEVNQQMAADTRNYRQHRLPKEAGR